MDTGAQNLELAWQTLHAVDYLQTRTIARDCRKDNRDFYETNYLLGECPTLTDVSAYFAITSAAHAGVAFLLPKKYLRVFQVGTIFVTGHAIQTNISLGVEISF